MQYVFMYQKTKNSNVIQLGIRCINNTYQFFFLINESLEFEDFIFQCKKQMQKSIFIEIR